MNSSKLIDISKSSLVGLKAELLKKQEEVKKLKECNKDIIKPASHQNKSKGSHKINKGVEERNLRDIEQTEVDFDVLQKSRKVLEAKARLYDKLKLNEGESKPKTQYLIDFDLKQEIYSNDKKDSQGKGNTCHLSEDEEDAYSDSNSDPENDWVDFVDTLGRSRRCLKKDLPEMKIKDANLAASLHPPSPPPVAEVTPELLSWDMQREMMRQKWEEQETLLLGKKDVHYQDVLFDEARPHGVGYFEFSTEESERLKQQQELKNLRKETLEQQEAAVGLRVRRQQQLEARLAAARRRKRERLGLPPDDPEPPETDVSVSILEDNEQQSSEKVEDLEDSIKKIAPIRPWDIGKQDSVMSQEEWVEKKRSERPQEFAPPSSLLGPADSRIPCLNNKFRTDFTENPFQNPTTRATSTNTDSFQNRFDKDLLKSKKNIQHFNSDTSYNNNSKGFVTNTSEHHPTIKNRKPTSEDIDIFLSKTKEIYYCGNEMKGPMRKQNASYKKELSNSKVIKSDSKEQEANHMLHTYSNTCDTLNEDMMRPEQKTQKHTLDGMNEFKGDDSFGTSLSIKRKRGAEIPPPPSMSYYNDGSSSNKHTSNKTDLSESISVGLNYLKTKENKKSRVKGLLHIM